MRYLYHRQNPLWKKPSKDKFENYSRAQAKYIFSAHPETNIVEIVEILTESKYLPKRGKRVPPEGVLVLRILTEFINKNYYWPAKPEWLLKLNPNNRNALYLAKQIYYGFKNLEDLPPLMNNTELLPVISWAMAGHHIKDPALTTINTQPTTPH